MIATCPACGKRYRLADDAVPAAGRSVRCAACGHGWTALPAAPGVPLPTSEALLSTPDLPPVAPRLPFDAPQAASPPASGTVSPRAAAAGTAPDISAGLVVPDGETEAPPRRRRGWMIATVFVVVALAGLAVVEFAPENTFDPPRLGLPAARLPLADLGSLVVPTLPSLDLTRIPVIGERLDALVNPPPAPASPLRITASGERRRLATGTWLLTVTGTVTNPTGAPVTLTAIDAVLVDVTGHLSFRWRIAAPASVIGAHATVTFESTAANFPPTATILRLRPR